MDIARFPLNQMSEHQAGSQGGACKSRLDYNALVILSRFYTRRFELWFCSFRCGGSGAVQCMVFVRFDRRYKRSHPVILCR